MDDLISRQQAIDALRGYLVEKRCPDDGTLTCRLIENEVINKLPPAEPKKRGMSIEQEKMIVQSLSSLYPLQEFEEKAIDTVLNAIPHWIPVTERLPAMGKSVLMCDIDGDIYLGHRTQCGYYFPDFCEDKIKDVRAWRELPEPYKGVTE